MRRRWQVRRVKQWRHQSGDRLYHLRISDCDPTEQLRLTMVRDNDALNSILYGHLSVLFQALSVYRHVRVCSALTATL